MGFVLAMLSYKAKSLLSVLSLAELDQVVLQVRHKRKLCCADRSVFSTLRRAESLAVLSLSCSQYGCDPVHAVTPEFHMLLTVLTHTLTTKRLAAV